MKESFESKVQVQELEPTWAYPEKNITESFGKLFWLMGWVTNTAKGNVEKNKPKVDRTLGVRRARARLLERFKQAKTKEEKKEILEEARERDRALEKFVFQKEITVNRDDIGEATVRYVDMKPPKEAEPKTPIVFIPGISNDLASVDTIVQELNVRGRRVVAFGYPSGVQGKMSNEFQDAVKELPGFEAHSRFFGSAIKEVMKDEQFELWGFSTGGPIVGEMLASKEIPSDRVERAVLLNPAASVKMSLKQLWAGLAREVRHITEKNIAAYPFVYDSKAPRTAQDKKEKDSIFKVLCTRICEPFTKWKDVRVKDGGEIIAVSAIDDKVTRCAEYFKEGNVGNHIKAIQVKGGHMAPAIDTERFLDAVDPKKGRAT